MHIVDQGRQVPTHGVVSAGLLVVEQVCDPAAEFRDVQCVATRPPSHRRQQRQAYCINCAVGSAVGRPGDRQSCQLRGRNLQRIGKGHGHRPTVKCPFPVLDPGEVPGTDPGELGYHP